MKRNIKIIVFLALSVLLVTGCSENSEDSVDSKGNSEDEFTIVFNNHAPATHHLAVNAFEPWKEMVEEKTEGRLKIDLYHGGVLGGADSVLDDVKGQVYDLGYMPGGYSYDTEAFPWTISDLPFVFEEPIQAAEIISKVSEKFGLDILNEHVHYIGTGVTDPSIVISKNPIEKATELKGKQIITSQRIAVDIIEGWGATPITMTYEETYEALQRGTADATILTGVGSVGHRYYEVAPYYIENLATGGMTAVTVMNKEVYNDLPSDLKELFDKELGPALIDAINQSYSKEMTLYVEDLKKEGVEFISLSNNELEKLHAPGKESWSKWEQMADERGYPGEEMIAELIRLLEEEGISVDFLKQ